MKDPKPKESIVVHVRVPRPIFKRLKEYATEDNRTTSGAMLYLATRMLEMVEQ
jgi:hypothetical protein